jgi:hypothetical protein
MVLDSTGRAVAFARITREGVGERVADDSGRFLLAMQRPGPIRLEARRVGFHPLITRVQIANDTALRLVMATLPASLAKVEIEAEATVRSLELNGFYRRLRDKNVGANTGHFILPEEIEQRRGSVTSIVTGIPGLRVERFRATERSREYQGLFGNSRRARGGALCAMTVYLDRNRINPPGSLLASHQGPADINAEVTLREVAGIEVYTRSNAPPEFSMLNGTCGVVVIWTK